LGIAREALSALRERDLDTGLRSPQEPSKTLPVSHSDLQLQIERAFYHILPLHEDAGHARESDRMKIRSRNPWSFSFSLCVEACCFMILQFHLRILTQLTQEPIVMNLE